jgi:hypothetical protein
VHCAIIGVYVNVNQQSPVTFALEGRRIGSLIAAGD